MKKVTKSLTALLLALVMSLTLLPTQALAAESAAKPRSYTVSYTNPLYAGIADSGTFISTRTAPATYAASAEAADTGYLTTRAAVIAELRSQMIDRQSTIEFKVKLEPGTIDLKGWWQEAISHVTGDGSSGDFLRWQFKSYDAGATPEKFNESWTGGYEVTYTVMWYTTSQQETQLNSYIKTTILPQLALGGKTTYQKVQAIYNWITKNVRYDYAHLNDSTYKLQYTAYAAAINKTAVCQGYANLFYRLANDAGIDCRIITGTADGGNGVWGPHAWNIVKMDDGNYYCLDATWDEGRSSYSYFLKGLPEFSKTHTPETDSYNTPYWTSYVSKMSNTDYNSAFAAAPANVTMRTAAVSGKDIVVTWQQAAGAARYKVFRKDPVNTGWKVVATVSGLSYTDKNATAGVKYSYTVRGVNTDGALSPGFDRTGVSAMVPKATAPANVTLGSAKAVSGGIQVTWQAANGAAKYNVYRKDASNTRWVVIGTVTGTSYTDKSAKAGVTYSYTVRGVGSDGKTLSPGYNKTGVSATIPAVSATPAKVVLVSAKADSAGILVTWQKANGAHAYQVYRKDAVNTKWTVIAKNVRDTEWKDITAVKGTKYTYTVRAVADDGVTLGGYDSAGKSAMVTASPTTPANVTLGTATAGKNGIVVTWSYAADARTYRVYRKAPGDTKWVAVANVNGKSWTDKNVTSGVKYSYTVRGVNANGKLSPGYNKTGVSTVAK